MNAGCWTGCGCGALCAARCLLSAAALAVAKLLTAFAFVRPVATQRSVVPACALRIKTTQ